MRVLHVIGPTEYGGAQTQLLGLIRAAHGTRWDASLCSTSPGPLLPAFRNLGVPVLDLRRRASPGLGRLVSLARHINGGHFDIVHSMLWHCNAYARLAVVGRGERPAVVVSERSVEPRSKRKRRLDGVLGRWTDLWIGNSLAVTDFMRQVHPTDESRLLHIPNAIDRSLFLPRSPGAHAAPTIGSVGRLEYEKGFDTLIAASRLLQPGMPGLHVLIAGSGSQRTHLEDLATGSSVRFVGPLTAGDAVAGFLAQLDAFVLPSRFGEGRPNVLMEALTCGVPVVATDIPGVAETVGRGGLLVPPEQPSELAVALSAVLADGSASSRALAAASAIPSFDHLADLYRDAFERALAHRDRIASRRR
jgi:glycosyltransferase involved in cell wall biosynthesis